jgi:hypothetical protein
LAWVGPATLVLRFIPPLAWLRPVLLGLRLLRRG